jgi:hypothetical protein
MWQWWVELVVVGGGLTGMRWGWVPVWRCTGCCDHRNDLWWPLYPQNILHPSLNANEHDEGVDVARKAHSPQTCTLPGRICSAPFSCQHCGDLYMCPHGIDSISVSTSVCPWQTRIVSVISADTDTYSKPWNTAQVQIVAREEFLWQGALNTWLQRVGRGERRMP